MLEGNNENNTDGSHTSTPNLRKRKSITSPPLPDSPYRTPATKRKKLESNAFGPSDLTKSIPSKEATTAELSSSIASLNNDFGSKKGLAENTTDGNETLSISLPEPPNTTPVKSHTMKQSKNETNTFDSTDPTTSISSVSPNDGNDSKKDSVENTTNGNETLSASNDKAAKHYAVSFEKIMKKHLEDGNKLHNENEKKKKHQEEEYMKRRQHHLQRGEDLSEMQRSFTKLVENYKKNEGGLKQQLVDSNDKIKKLEDEHRAFQNDLQEKENELQRRVGELQDKLEQKENECIVLRNDYDDQENQLKSTMSFLDELQDELEQKENERIVIRKKYDDLKNHLKSAVSFLAAKPGTVPAILQDPTVSSSCSSEDRAGSN